LNPRSFRAAVGHKLNEFRQFQCEQSEPPKALPPGRGEWRGAPRGAVVREADFKSLYFTKTDY